MHKAGAFFLILLLGFQVLLFAQDDNDPAIEIDWDDYTIDLYAAGDQSFIMALGVVFPTVFINNGTVIDHQFSPPVGGAGTLIYNYYLQPFLFTGAEIGLMFLPTIGGNTIFLVPLGLRFGTQFLIWRLEFPISLTVGVSWHNYLNLGYFGLFVKAGAAAFYRATSDWSFGLTANWSLFPQWTSDPSKNVYGNFLELTLSARYHF
ncbi:MAG: hypothetical protein FWD13_01565 [Treponema sp.]|nr:hypothetical protein [Treponema sp.]